MMQPVTGIVGIDPGSRETGLLYLNMRGEPEDACVINRKEDDWHSYQREIHDWLYSSCAYGCPLAVETVVAPRVFFKGKKQMLHPESLIGTSRVWGWIEVMANAGEHRVIGVPPGKNGSGPQEAYPPELWGEREGPAGSGWRRHVRSAYDIARAGLILADLQPMSEYAADKLAEMHSPESDKDQALAHLAKIREKLPNSVIRTEEV